MVTCPSGRSLQAADSITRQHAAGWSFFQTLFVSVLWNSLCHPSKTWLMSGLLF